MVSLLGSGLTAFALGVWIYRRTDSVMLLVLNMVAYALPQVVLSPLAGALADRWNRRIAMIVSDLGGMASVLGFTLLFFTGTLAPWNIYLGTAVMAAFNALQWPAWSAATTLLVPKEHFGRASGMVQSVEAISLLASPAIAGVLYVTVGLGSLVLMDAGSYAIAILIMIFFVRVPDPPESPEGKDAERTLRADMRFGWTYILARPNLLGLLLYFAVANFLGGMVYPLLQPMILDTWSEEVFGFLSSFMGLGTLVGTLFMGVWGGPKHRIVGLLGGGVLCGLFTAAMGFRPSLALLAVAGFAAMFFVPIMNACSQAIWQTKVPADLQGRVFSVRRMIAQFLSPLAMLLAAPLADKVFKPLLVGVGPGRGIGLQIIVLGVLSALISVPASLIPRIRRVEIDLPDAVGAEASQKR